MEPQRSPGGSPWKALGCRRGAWDTRPFRFCQDHRRRLAARSSAPGGGHRSGHLRDLRDLRYEDQTGVARTGRDLIAAFHREIDPTGLKSLTIAVRDDGPNARARTDLVTCDPQVARDADTWRPPPREFHAD